MQASEVRHQKKQKRKAEEGQLQAKRQEMDKAKVCSQQNPALSGLLYVLSFAQIQDAVKRYSYLLGQTELFKHFVDIKV